VTAHGGLVLDGNIPDLMVKPADNTLNQIYTFYIKVTANGGSSQFFGPHELDVGCSRAVYTDSPSFVTSVSVPVGNDGIGFYTVFEPAASISWCGVVT